MEYDWVVVQCRDRYRGPQQGRHHRGVTGRRGWVPVSAPHGGPGVSLGATLRLRISPEPRPAKGPQGHRQSWEWIAPDGSAVGAEGVGQSVRPLRRRRKSHLTNVQNCCIMRVVDIPLPLQTGDVVCDSHKESLDGSLIMNPPAVATRGVCI